MKEAMFTYEEFMEKLGLQGEFFSVKDIVASMKEPCPRIEVIFHSFDTTARSEK